MDPLEREIERLKTGLLGKNVVKAPRQCTLLRVTRGALKYLELLIELPDLAADGRLGRAIGVTKGQERVNRTFGVNPTQGIEKPRDLKLPRIVTENHQLRRHTVTEETGHEGTFGSDSEVALS